MAKEEVFEYFNGGLQCKSFVTFEEMRRKGEKVDVTVKCGTQSFSAHSVVLSAGIPYFRSLFGNNVSKAKMQVVTIRGAHPAALECLVDYAYTGRVKITETNVESLLLCSEFLQVTEVTESCCRFLSEHLSPENVIRTQKIAKNLSYTSLTKSAYKYVRTHFDAICRTNGFLSAPFPFVHDLIRRDDLNMEKVLEAVKKWLMADFERKRYLPKLLAGVRIPLPSSYSIARLYTQEPIQTTITHGDLGRATRHPHLSPKAVVMNNCRHKFLEGKTLKNKPLMCFKPRDSSGQNGRGSSTWKAAGFRHCRCAFHVSKVKGVPPNSWKNVIQGRWNSIDWENASINDWSDEDMFNNTESECDDGDVENDSCDAFSAADGVEIDSDIEYRKDRREAFRYSRRWRTYGCSYKRPQFRNSRKFHQKINYWDLLADYYASSSDDDE